jgi:hypothetical protein
MSVAGFEADGFVIVAGILSGADCAGAASQVRLADAASGGTRCLLSQPWCAALAARLRAHAALSDYIPAGHLAVQCNYFEKSAGRNWLVPLHQDLSIPVAARVAEPALRGWSEKEGMLFVRAPLDVLQQLVVVRIHLDPCNAEDGPLRVMPGSHRRGLISDSDAVACRVAGVEAVCLAGKGDALVMRPLLLHASSKGSGGGRRRVLHFVFGPRELPFCLSWNAAL